MSEVQGDRIWNLFFLGGREEEGGKNSRILISCEMAAPKKNSLQPSIIPRSALKTIFSHTLSIILLDTDRGTGL